MKELIIAKLKSPSTSYEFKSAVESVSKAIADIFEDNFSEEAREKVKRDIEVIVDELDDREIDKMTHKEFLQTWVNEFMRY